MAYNFTKLSETPIVESTEATPNILIEDDGDIKRISAVDLTTPQVNADWDETDVTSPAFIMNKPTSLGGGANVITYAISRTISSESVPDYLVKFVDREYVVVTAQEVIDTWDNGAIIRIRDYSTGCISQALGIYYTMSSGAVTSAAVSYFGGSAIKSITVY